MGRQFRIVWLLSRMKGRSSQLPVSQVVVQKLSQKVVRPMSQMVLLRVLLMVALALSLASCRGPRQAALAGDTSSCHSEEAGGRRKNLAAPAPGDVLTDSDLGSFDLSSFFYAVPIDSAVFARIDGRSYKEGCPVAVEDLRYLRILHKDADGRTLVGEMIANQSIADDLLAIFRALYDAGYPIEKVRLIDDYGGDDESSMLDNNTSCFNYRRKSHMSAVSKHALGEAVDINPLYNPYTRVTASGARIVEPAASVQYLDRSGDFPYKISRGDLCHRLFLEHGFHWGGSWTRSKDYQHFER